MPWQTVLTVHVAVGVVINAIGHILIAQRHFHTDHGGLWEFPGGKVEANEAVYDALCRELKEEVQLTILAAIPLIKVPYHYDHYSVLLDTWIINAFSGEAHGVEGNAIQWVTISELQHLKMPDANERIINALNAAMI